MKTVLKFKWRDLGKTLDAAMQQVADAAAAARDEPLTADELSGIAAFLSKADPYPLVALSLMSELLSYPYAVATVSQAPPVPSSWQPASP